MLSCESIEKAVRSKGIKKCPLCGNDGWDYFNGVFVTPQIAKKGEAIKSPVGMPVIQLSCDKCGFVAQFSAVKLGLIEK